MIRFTYNSSANSICDVRGGEYNLDDSVEVEMLCLKLNKLDKELIDLHKKIVMTLNNEIKDCEILFDVDEDDEYTQGRLVEIHNLMRELTL